MRAYIFIDVKAGKAKSIAKQLVDLPGVQAVDACWGTPDVIAVVDVKNERALNDLVFGEIAKAEGVERTDTHIALE